MFSETLRIIQGNARELATLVGGANEHKECRNTKCVSAQLLR